MQSLPRMEPAQSEEGTGLQPLASDRMYRGITLAAMFFLLASLWAF